MRTLTYRFLLVLGIAVLTLGTTGCDNFEDNLDFEAGDSLRISGPATATTGQTRAYYVEAFTIAQNYTWNVSNGATGSVRREGEFYDVTFPSPGTYTVTVNNGTYSGTRTVTVSNPAP